jgi:LacI family transcriptional regulator
VRFPHYQLGVEAATLLIQRIEAQDSPVKVLLLAPELVARGSTNRPSDLPRAEAAIPLHHDRAGT